MGMSTHVIGFAPPDETWRKHKAVWDACVSAGVPVPEETNRFFGDVAPDQNGVEIEIPSHEWSDGESQGIEIDVLDIPKSAKVIRFFNCW